MEKLNINNLKLEINGKIVLNNISLDIRKGETILIIGESGSGKTVLSKMLIGIKPQFSKINGEICFDKKNIFSIKEKEWQNIRGKKISYISQNPLAVFNDFQTIESHILEFFQSHLKISKKDCLNKIEKCMEKLNFKNFSEILKKYPFQLSGGMLQRIMFAMMIELNPEVLIVDEPTSALDFKNRNNIIEMLKNYQTNDKILIIITHDYEILEKLEGELIIIKNGNIVEKGNTKEILQNPKTEYGKKLLLK